jgi:hypothetical protein
MVVFYLIMMGVPKNEIQNEQNNFSLIRPS